MMTMISIADVSQVPLGGAATDALANTRHLACLAEALGYERYWVAEHHGDAAVVASCAPEVMIAHLAGVTDRIRIGSGAVLVNNVSPFRVAENFPKSTEEILEIEILRSLNSNGEALDSHRPSFVL